MRYYLDSEQNKAKCKLIKLNDAHNDVKQYVKNTVEEINIDMTLTLAFDKFKSELNNFMVQLENQFRVLRHWRITSEHGTTCTYDI